LFHPHTAAGGGLIGAGLKAQAMRRQTVLAGVVVLAATFGVALRSEAHSGGPLDADGCHVDHRTDTYHCHRGVAAGYTFPNRDAMLEAVRTGKFPEKSVETESFLSKLWPWGKHHHEQQAGDAPSAEGTVVGQGSSEGAVTDKNQQAAEKLKVLQGLYEMGLITKDEYEGKRKAIQDQT
jgi:hypothetical protein